jgi:hypothetical protein
MPQGTMSGPKKRSEKPDEPENPNSILNILKRGFMPTSERIDAQVQADIDEKEIKRRKAQGEYKD